MMKAVFTALALGAGVFLVSPGTASAAPPALQGATAPDSGTVEKVHGRRHGHYGHHYRHRHWHHRHHYARPYYRHHHYRRHYQAGPYFGFSFGPSWGYGHHHHRRWH